ncbi:MAG: FprA family A-type flavoprotein [Desulfobacca sp.]|nr:FprA family A-type flavoprotein [Desulfobacca sp.]
MKARKISDGVYWMGAIDWDRRLFDALIPLPDGTSYNAYLIQGTEKTALLDTVDPSQAEVLRAQLAEIDRLDYVIAHHAEQDHSGSIPMVLEIFPEAQVVTNPKCKGLLIDLLGVAEDRFITVQDGDTLNLGDKTLKFIYTPWVHWPETMVTYLEEEQFLFSCDFFGSHLATSDLYADEGSIYRSAKRYFAEIMMPFRPVIQNNLEKLNNYDIAMIAPSHGPIYLRPQFIMGAYLDWISVDPRNLVVLPHVSMHGSTAKMVDHLIGALIAQGVRVEPFNLVVADIGELAMALVDAATVVIGTPTVLVGPHPLAVYAAFLANALRPKLKFASIIGSFGWGGKAVETLTGLMPNLKVEILEPVICKGLPKAADYQALDNLAASIATKHREHNLV